MPVKFTKVIQAFLRLPKKLLACLLAAGRGLLVPSVSPVEYARFVAQQRFLLDFSLVVSGPSFSARQKFLVPVVWSAS